MRTNDESRQWDDLLEQAFGDEGKPDAAFSASASPPRKRPFYRKPRFWLALTALLVVIGAAIWFFAKETQPEDPLSPDDPRMEEALEMCKNALTQWQARETYHIHLSGLYYGDTADGTGEADFWRSGKDFLLITRSTSLGTVHGYLYQDGIMYASYANSQQGAGTNIIQPWTEWQAEAEEIESNIPWPMGFDWDASQIKGLSRDYVPNGSGGYRLSTVAFAVVQDESVSDVQSPYHVSFTFGTGDVLESVTVVNTTPGEAEKTSVTVITFRMGTETESEIEMKVGTALRMPLTALTPPSIARTDPA